ncbi:9059_t:CDS:2 [Funneliformis mosseae]|uniref:Protein PNS1 n=1 Tax=Funneliformis mosseae TaxID=27381 RepID=A0A9N9EHS9_FUNMO|nr:9059_t:CDS:2 [Funneliformis mosseae]
MSRMNYYGQPGQPGHYNQSGQPGEQYYQYYPPPPPTEPKYNPNAHQYSPPPVPPPSFSQSQSMGGGRAAIFFLLHFVAFIAVSVIALRNYAVLQRSGAKTGQDVTLNWSILWLLLVCVGIVIQTWVHVTTSGVFATYYFLAGTPEGVPSSPTLKSAKRASTTSFGSICLGSLLVAILQVIGALLRSAAQDTDNPFGAFCAACAAVLVGCIESLLQYFNFYAYTQVAIYGKSFWESAKDTWALVKDRGVDAIINDNLIGNVLVMGAFLVGIITALLSYLYTIIFELSFNRNGEFTPLIVFLGFIVGFQMLNIIGSVILSGTATTFLFT